MVLVTAVFVGINWNYGKKSVNGVQERRRGEEVGGGKRREERGEERREGDRERDDRQNEAQDISRTTFSS